MFQASANRKGRTTRRLAPHGYVAVDKNLARQLFDHGEAVSILGNKTNAFHAFAGWCLACTVTKSTSGDQFDAIVQSFLDYLDPELGTYPVLYVQKTTLKKE